MKELMVRFFRGFIVFCFYIVSRILRQKPHIKGDNNLKNLPTPLIFTPTHDTYFEIPSLSRVYYSLKPRPDLTFLGKTDMLSGRYLSENFGSRNRLVHFLCALLDKTGLPRFIFKTMRVTTIHRPFAETYQKDSEEIRAEIGEQLCQVEKDVSKGFSTVIFPEGTTWGYGGLKPIRSAVYQIVEHAADEDHTKVYLLPINIKVDGLTKGRKDIFINIGEPVFYRSTKERFNRKLSNLLNRLHTVTFSQIAAYYLMRVAEWERDSGMNLSLSPESLASGIRQVVDDFMKLAGRIQLPNVDEKLYEGKYLNDKIKRFIKYCSTKNYLMRTYLEGRKRAFYLNINTILNTYPEKLYRKLNPLGFYAHELISINEKRIRRLIDRRLENLLSSNSALS